MKVDVCIPVYKPEDEFYSLMRRLSRQSVRISTLRIVNTCEEFWKDDFLSDIRDAGIAVSLKHITKEMFDHGRVRDMMARESDADYLLFMTQDAIPADTHLIERLMDGFTRGKVASCYARQLPKKGCAPLEKMSRIFNYPKTSVLKSGEDLESMGIKTFFCSNVCAMYNREIYLALGGFPTKTIFNEDMIFARGVIDAGFMISYCADARVYHSHNYTLKQYCRRSFDMAVSQAMYPDVFSGISSESEGMKLVKAVSRKLLGRGDILGECRFVVQCFAKYLGYFLGKRYKKLPHKMVIFLSDNKHFWKNE
ncbi:MAG: glycosyltransferase family 2 protein [Lachnospiraceae bacterium]|nr:glycosyltransferase family 2 protein [Lachnospiraceae bacterium]